MSTEIEDPLSTRSPHTLAALVAAAFIAAPRENLPLISINGRDIAGLGEALDGDSVPAMRVAICRALRPHVMLPAPDVEIHLWVDGGRECFSSYTIMEASS